MSDEPAPPSSLQSPPAAPAAPPAPSARRWPAWESIVSASWRPVTAYALFWIAAVIIVWEILYAGGLYDFITSPDNRDVRVAQDPARLMLLRMLPAAVAGGLFSAWRVLRRVLRGESPRAPACLWIMVAATAVPFLYLPGVEFQNVYLVGAMVISVAVAVAYALRAWLLGARQGGWRDWDLSPRAAWGLTLAAWATFALVMGFLAHWRFITFHAEPYDTSWETNAVWGITHHGIPSTSVGADPFHRTQHLPAPFFDAHAPFSYYLVYAPFYFFFPDSRTLLWLQALWMGAGSVGAYFIGRTWFRRQWAGVALAWVYALNPGIQGHCLHDLHGNVLAISFVVLAAGLMEAGYVRAAVATAFFVAICREETALYSACLGLFWMLSFRDRTRLRSGALVIAWSLLVLFLITQVLMPAFGGRPDWNHFNLFFRGGGIASVIGAYLLNPWGALMAATEPEKLDFFWMSAIPVGLLVVWGWRAGWFALLGLALLVASGNPSFFTPGMNYSAPTGVVMIMMGFAGARAWLLARRNRTAVELDANRVAVVAYLLVAAVAGDLLYGNILSKAYQLEYGQAPYRRASQFDYRGRMGSLVTLPPYGQRERELWDVVRHVPKDAPIATSWSVNPQLSSRDVAVLLPYMAATNPLDNHPRYVVIDKLPPMIENPEKWWLQFRSDPGWHVYYENNQGVIFERN
ncbi:MAG TPA: DUF2079 domain-containing protein [Polyangia bacterium]